MGTALSSRSSLKARAGDARYGKLREQRRRRPWPMALTPRAVMASPPTAFFAKGSGVTAAPVSAGGSGYVVGDLITLTGGTFNAAGILRVATVSAGAVATVTIAQPGLYTVNPTNPTAQGSTSGAGTGATFTLTLNAGSPCGVTDKVVYGPTSTVFRFVGNGPGNISASGYYGNTSGSDTAAWWEFTTDATEVDLRILGFNAKVVAFVDGQMVSTVGVSSDASGAFYVYNLDFGGVQQVRNIRVFGINLAFGGVAVPANATVWKPTEPRRPLMWVMGDSYTFGTNATSVATAGVVEMAEMLGYDCLPDGIGGTGWTSVSTSAPATRVANKLAPLTVAPELIVFDMGFNNSASDQTATGDGFDAAAVAAKTAWPGVPIVAFGPATPVGSTAGLTNVKNTISARAAAKSIPFIDVENWVNSVNKAVYTAVDVTHPTQVGYDYLAARKAEALAAVLDALSS